MALFESYERRIDQINKVLNSYGIASIEEAEKITKDAGLNVYASGKEDPADLFRECLLGVHGRRGHRHQEGMPQRRRTQQPLSARDCQSFCIPGSVADHRKVGLGHGNLGKMLLEEETEMLRFPGRS